MKQDSSSHRDDTEQLLNRAQGGDSIAVQHLLTRYRHRLLRLIDATLDPDVSGRVDLSDVLQGALTRASRRLPDYLDKRPIAFYPWLRQIVREELIHIHRFHVDAVKRSVRREKQLGEHLSEESGNKLAGYLDGREETPSSVLRSKESRQQIRQAMAALDPTDQEILMLRCIEYRSIREIQSLLGISEAAIKSRFRRALQKLAVRMKYRP